MKLNQLQNISLSDGKEPTCNVGDLGSFPRLGRSPGGWQSTPVFLPGKSYGQRSLQATVHGVTGVGHSLVTKPPQSPHS